MRMWGDQLERAERYYSLNASINRNGSTIDNAIDKYKQVTYQDAFEVSSEAREAWNRSFEIVRTESLPDEISQQ